MQDRPPYRAGELLQTAATITAITLALATLVENDGPQHNGYYLVPLTLLVGDLCTTAGSLFAMWDLKNELSRHSSASGWFYFIEWGLYIIGAAYAWFLVDNVP